MWFCVSSGGSNNLALLLLSRPLQSVLKTAARVILVKSGRPSGCAAYWLPLMASLLILSKFTVLAGSDKALHQWWKGWEAKWDGSNSEMINSKETLSAIGWKDERMSRVMEPRSQRHQGKLSLWRRKCCLRHPLWPTEREYMGEEK